FAERMPRNIVQALIQRQFGEDLLTQSRRVRTLMQTDPEFDTGAATSIHDVDQIHLAVGESREICGDTGLVGDSVERITHVRQEHASAVLSECDTRETRPEHQPIRLVYEIAL